MQTVKLRGLTNAQALQMKQGRQSASERIAATVDTLQAQLCEYRQNVPEPMPGDDMMPCDWEHFDRVTDLLLAVEAFTRG